MCFKVKYLLVFFSLIFTSLTNNAQYYGREEYTQLSGGVFGGFNFAQINGDGYKGYDKLGYTAGGTLFLPLQNVDLPFPGTIALNMEVAMTQMGAFGNVSYGTIQSQKINLNYAQIPFQIYYYRGTRKSNVGLGFAVGYLGWENIQFDQGMGYEELKTKVYNKFDFGFVFTPNIHLYKGFYLSPRYYYSLINVAKSAGLTGNAHQFNNSISLRLMYLFSKDGY